MARFNPIKTKESKKTKNRAGGEAYVMSSEMQLATLLLTSFAQDQFYRSAKTSFNEIVTLLTKVEPSFAAKAALFARNEYGMRSITHVLAGELAQYASGTAWAKRFYEKVIRRPDDMLEIMAYFYSKQKSKNKSLPNAMKKGFAKAFDHFDSYQLGKYRGEARAVKLIDVVNLVHPTPTQRNKRALKELVEGKLRANNTWETMLTQAGQKSSTAKEKADNKRQAWTELIENRKLGYMALLRNLRNIAQQAPELLGEVCKQLTNPRSIHKSLVLPFRFLAAMDAVKELAPKGRNPLVKALNQALDIAVGNVPKFDGTTLVVLDDSGSMTGGSVRGMNRRPINIGSLFAAILYKSNNADLMTFSDSARYVNANPNDTTDTIANNLIKNARAAGTNFKAIFQKAKRAYDRIIILSDMQGWMGYSSPDAEYKAYKHKYKVNPYVYSFDLTGYGSFQLPEHKIFALAGFSEKVFEMMKMLEQDPKALVNRINAVEL